MFNYSRALIAYIQSSSELHTSQLIKLKHELTENVYKTVIQEMEKSNIQIVNSTHESIIIWCS